MMSPLSRRLAEEIAAEGGVLRFDRFMERALYEPGLGYYERPDTNVGRHGDFFTSVSVGSVFGELLALQFTRWCDDLTSPMGEPLRLIEAGAHDGQLAADILSWIQEWRPDLQEKIRYTLIEPSPVRQARQRARLADFAGRVEWWNAIQPFSGILFANELLDAFPIRRFGWSRSQRRWFEWGVALQTTEPFFVWAQLPGELDAPVASLPDAVLNSIPDGFVFERSLAAEAWWRAAANSLNLGWLVAADYGTRMDLPLDPDRLEGTLRAYREHRVTRQVLEHPGEQDLTAHVNFDHLRQAGEASGLQTAALETQERWLNRIFAETTTASNRFWTWTPQRVRQFQTLTHPGHLGRAFSVLVQQRPAELGSTTPTSPPIE